MRNGLTFGCAIKIRPIVIPKIMIAVLRLSVNTYVMNASAPPLPASIIKPFSVPIFLPIFTII